MNWITRHADCRAKTRQVKYLSEQRYSNLKQASTMETCDARGFCVFSCLQRNNGNVHMTKARSVQLIEKSIAAMIAAIDTYNSPGQLYREETFAILALNAWELLFKAK